MLTSVHSLLAFISGWLHEHQSRPHSNSWYSKLLTAGQQPSCYKNETEICLEEVMLNGLYLYIK